MNRLLCFAALLPLAIVAAWPAACSSSVTTHTTATGAGGSASAGPGASTTGATASAGTGASTTGATGSGVTGSGGASTTASSGASSGSGGGCAGCSGAWTCCNGACVAPLNDIANCGACGKVCGGAHPYCDNGKCVTSPPCDGGACGAATFCCGSSCCMPGELCCEIPSNTPTFPTCVPPENGTCPKGCNLCP